MGIEPDMDGTLRSLVTLLAVVSMLASAAPAGADASAAPIAAANAPDGLALRGYDPVAYFTDAKPRRGLPELTATHDGATYRFTSAEHRNRFLADPARYVPQYGGYCAFAMSIDRIADADPERWVIVNDKLHVNKNRLAHGLWSIGTAGRIESADRYWPAFPKTPVVQ
jgi:hypothetical protein